MQQISVDTLKHMLSQDPNLALLDVREPYEHARFHLSDLLISLGELPHRLAELEAYREQILVVYCEHGVRSQYAAYFLSENGFKQVYSLIGGTAAWETESN